MELAFATKPLREICESEDKAKQKLGTKVAAVLKHRLADLRAAATMSDLPVGDLTKNADVCILKLNSTVQMTLCPNHVSKPVLKSGDVDWTKVTRIKITDLEISA